MTQCSLMLPYKKYRGFAEILKGHIGSQKHCTLVNQQIREGLTAVMGAVPGRAGRHNSYSRRGNDVVVRSVNPVDQVAGAAMFETWPVGHAGVDGTGVCVPFPTKESFLRNAGETRDLTVMLAQSIARGQCFFSEPDVLRKPAAIEGDDVDSLAPMLVW